MKLIFNSVYRFARRFAWKVALDAVVNFYTKLSMKCDKRSDKLEDMSWLPLNLSLFLCFALYIVQVRCDSLCKCLKHLELVTKSTICKIYITRNMLRREVYFLTSSIYHVLTVHASFWDSIWDRRLIYTFETSNVSRCSLCFQVQNKLGTWILGFSSRMFDFFSLRTWT